jgi:protein tyrosine/serine phosphatase
VVAVRTLNWPDCGNVRDLGGLPTAYGELPAGRLIRSDNLDRLTAEGLAAVDSAGITRFVDLRSAWECETYPSPFASDPRWRNFPLWDPADEEAPGFDLYDQYRAMVDDQAARVASAIGAIADAPPGCVVVNCHAGMDRTGVVIALTLDLLGVPADLIVADYEASGAPPSTIRRLLTHLRTHHAGTPNYLTRAGVTAGQLGDLRRRMVG